MCEIKTKEKKEEKSKCDLGSVYVGPNRRKSVILLLVVVGNVRTVYTDIC